MTLIVGARCRDGVTLAADRRRMSRYEKGPSATKLFVLSCGVAIAGAGDDAVLNEARVFIDRRIKELQAQNSINTLFDVVEVVANVVNELVGFYKGTVEEPFGYVLSGLENLGKGNGRLYAVFGAGISDLPWACLGSGSSYARPLVELILAPGDLRVNDAAKAMPAIFTLVSNVQMTVGDGIDICIVKDDRGMGAIAHEKEVNLAGLRSAILDGIDVNLYSAPLSPTKNSKVRDIKGTNHKLTPPERVHSAETRKAVHHTRLRHPPGKSTDGRTLAPSGRAFARGHNPPLKYEGMRNAIDALTACKSPTREDYHFHYDVDYRRDGIYVERKPGQGYRALQEDLDAMLAKLDVG